MSFISFDMTASIPNGISFDDLQNFANEAAERETSIVKVENLEPTKENIFTVATECLDLAASKISDPMVHKIMILEALSNLMEWHSKVGQNMFDEDQTDSGTAWLRDAGKLQACMTLMCSINMGENDYVTE